jgi:hypothetical protein
MGLNDIKVESIEFYVEDHVQAIGKKLQSVATQLKATVEQLQSSSGGLAQFDDRADLEIVFKGKLGIMSNGPQWAVQVYVIDEGDRRGVQLVALGHSGLSIVLLGASGAFDMGASRKRRDMIELALKS